MKEWWLKSISGFHKIQHWNLIKSAAGPKCQATIQIVEHLVYVLKTARPKVLPSPWISWSYPQITMEASGPTSQTLYYCCGKFSSISTASSPWQRQQMDVEHGLWYGFYKLPTTCSPWTSSLGQGLARYRWWSSGKKGNDGTQLLGLKEWGIIRWVF